MPMSGMIDMTPTSQAKSLRMPIVFLQEEKICYRIVYYTSHLN